MSIATQALIDEGKDIGREEGRAEERTASAYRHFLNAIDQGISEDVAMGIAEINPEQAVYAKANKDAILGKH